MDSDGGQLGWGRSKLVWRLGWTYKYMKPNDKKLFIWTLEKHKKHTKHKGSEVSCHVDIRAPGCDSDCDLVVLLHLLHFLTVKCGQLLRFTSESPRSPLQASRHGSWCMMHKAAWSLMKLYFVNSHCGLLQPTGVIESHSSCLKIFLTTRNLQDLVVQVMYLCDRMNCFLNYKWCEELHVEQEPRFFSSLRIYEANFVIIIIINSHREVNPSHLKWSEVPN